MEASNLDRQTVPPPLVAGNWKMNPASAADAARLARDVAAAVGSLPVQTVVCPPAIWLTAVSDALAGSGIEIGSQTMRAEERGAFTGETSPLMLAGLASFCIIGHSERRQYSCETDDEVAARVASAVAHGIRPIAAIGEREGERRAGETHQVIERQLAAAISGLRSLTGTGLVVAYEPVWAIGTGMAASARDAQEVAARIRAQLGELDPAGADEIPILYGGSVAPANAGEFFAAPDIDGALVGGASLDAPQFAAIARAAVAAAA